MASDARLRQEHEEWSRTLTAPEADRWQGRIEGYGDAVNVLGAAPFVDATVAEFAANLARGCARFSHLRSQQRMRAYKRAARVRSVNAERNESILQDRAAGASIRKLAGRYGLTVGGIQHVLRGGSLTANHTPETAPSISANHTPRTCSIPTANHTPDRMVCRPPDPEQVSTTNNEVGAGPPPPHIRVAGGAVHAAPEREGAAPTDKAGGCGRGQPSHGAPAPAGATSHPLVTLPTETEPASGGATDSGPEPKVGEQVASLVVELAERHTAPTGNDKAPELPAGFGGLARAIREGTERAKANPDRLRTPEELAQAALDRDAAVRERDRLRVAEWYRAHPEHAPGELE